MPAALVDAGPMVAMFGAADAQRSRYRELFERAARENWALATTWPCIVEASHLVAPPRRFALLRWVAAGAVSVYPFGSEELEGMVELMRRYTESPRSEMDFADASLVWLAADTDVTTVMTMDIRDFSRYRLPDGRAFQIL